MSELEQIKAKYPLAVDALEGKRFGLEISKYGTIITSEGRIKIEVYSIKDKTEKEIGKMLAEVLNLIAK